MIPETIKDIAQTVKTAGGELWVIGGTVRETLYREEWPHTYIHSSKDYDCEVYGLMPDELEEILVQYGEVDLVGKQFGVFHLTQGDLQADFNLPRSDSVGRKPMVNISPTMDKIEATMRRNFICNTAMYNPLSGKMLDYFGAKDNIANRKLIVTHEARFRDDPLRPLIGLFLCGAYSLTPDPNTLAICRQMVWGHETLPPSRIWGEWWKWATRSIEPSRGLNFLKASGWIKNYPELDILDTIPQDAEWHPEGNVWQHTLEVVDRAADMTKYWTDDTSRGVVLLAALCHDLDKATCTTEEIKDGKLRIVSPGHDEGIGTERFLARIHCPNDIKERVLALVRTHMAHIGGMKPKKLLKRIGDNSPLNWLTLVAADHMGRPPLPQIVPVEALKLFEEMERVDPEEIVPLVTGKHLMATGIKPGPAMGNVLKLIFELGQLEGEFNTLEAGLEWSFRMGFITNLHSPDGSIKPEVLNAKRNK